jgi:hypothetical protein
MTMIIYVIIENIYKLEEGTMTRVSSSLSLTTEEDCFLQSQWIPQLRLHLCKQVMSKGSVSSGFVGHSKPNLGSYKPCTDRLSQQMVLFSEPRHYD